MNLTQLAYTCEPIYNHIKMEVETSYHIYHFITVEEFEEQVEQKYNQDTFSSRVDTSDWYGDVNDDILVIDYTFDIVKCVMDICREEYGYTYKLTTFEKAVDMFAYFCAKEIMREIIAEHHIGVNDPDETYNHHNDENDMEYQEI